MTRMPMIAVTATSLLLLLLVLTATPASGRAVKPTAAPAEIPEDEQEHTSLSSFNVNTVTIEIDSDLILTTEDGIQAFTQFPEVGQATTEEPLPESVLLQLERERLEQELQNPTNHTAEISEDANSADRLKPQLTTTPKPATTTSKDAALVTTPITTTESAAIESSKSQDTQSFREQNVNLNDNSEELMLEEGRLEAYLETTTYLPELPNEESAKLVDDWGNFFSTDPSVMYTDDLAAAEHIYPTRVPLVEEQQNSNEEESNTHLTNPAESAANTTEMTADKLETTLPPEVETVAAESHMEKLVEILHAMNTRDVNEMITMKPDELTTTTVEPLQPDLTTVNSAESDSSTIHPLEELTVTTLAAPKLLDMQLLAETTSSPDVTTTPTPITTIPTTDSPTTTTTDSTTTNSPTTDSPTTESYTTTNTATETTTSTPTTPTPTTTATTPTPTTIIPTTAPIPTQPTRTARVERIFNPDGVEVLYGYSSVVRTHHS